MPYHRGASLSCPGTRLVIGQNQSLPTTDAYAGAQVITPSTSAIGCSPGAGKANVTITPAFKFAALLPPITHVFVVSGAIAYECNLGARTLTRYENYPIAAGIAANRNAAGTIAVIATDVETCNVNYLPSTVSHGDLVSVSIQLKRAVIPPNPPIPDFMTVFIQAPVENLP